MSSPIPLWIDCDPGHDDAFALLLAAQHPAFNLLGVSTVSGNAPVEHTTTNALGILAAVGRPDVCVYEGAAQPLKRPARRAARFHGETGLAGTDLLPVVKRPDTTPSPHASREIRDAILEQPQNTVWLVAIGPLTNIAALLKSYPEVAEWVAGLSVMGGAVGGGFAHAPLGKHGDRGEIVNFPSEWAEFNTWCDPEAAAAVYGNSTISAKTILAPLDLTYQVLVNAEAEAALFPGGTDCNSRSRVRQLFYEILLHNKHSYQGYFPSLPGPPLHDVLAVALLLDSFGLQKEIGERWDVVVVLSGEQDGRTVMRLCSEGKPGVIIPRGMEEKSIWDALGLALYRAETIEPLRQRDGIILTQ